MCIDWKRDNVLLGGTTGSAKYRYLDISMVPCGMRETNMGGTEDRIPEDCNYDRKALIEYLGSIQMKIYYN